MEQKLDLILGALSFLSFVGFYVIAAKSHDGRYVALAWLSGLFYIVGRNVVKIPPSWIRGLFGGMIGPWSALTLIALAGIVWESTQPIKTMLQVSFMMGILLAIASHVASSTIERKPQSVPRPSQH